MSSLAPRSGLVTRRTEFERLLAAHATRGQTEFFLQQRGQDLGELESIHRQQLEAVGRVRQAIPDDWSIAQVLREDLDRFLFTADDIVVAIGQDGLVANLAKYLDAQPVIGVTPDPERTEGVLTPLAARALDGMLPAVAAGELALQRRTMVEATLDDGQRLTALNELFIGHRSHQSARYLLQRGSVGEAQSSSGVIVSTGTGLTGWARSILTATHRNCQIGPTERRAAFFAREPWPGRGSGCTLEFGEIAEEEDLAVVSRMNDGGVIFADGIEQDFLHFDWGVRASVALSTRTLNLVSAG